MTLLLFELWMALPLPTAASTCMLSALALPTLGVSIWGLQYYLAASCNDGDDKSRGSRARGGAARCYSNDAMVCGRLVEYLSLLAFRRLRPIVS